MIEKLHHYSMTHPASIYDEEALTSLELAGRTAKKVNDCIDEVNKIPENITGEVQRQIENGTFDNQINKFAGDVKAQVQKSEQDMAKELNEAEQNLGSRLDNLLGSVVVGSTTMDSEIIDIRVGADGKDYANAGESVRTQFQDVHALIKPITEEFTWTDGNFVYREQVVTHDNYSATDFIRVVPGLSIYVRTKVSSQASIVFYDQNREYKSGKTNSAGNVPFIYETVVPEGCYYMRVSCNTSYKDNAVIGYNMKEELDKLVYNEYFKSLRQVEGYEELTWTDGYYLYMNGQIVEYNTGNGYSYCDYVKVPPFARVYVRTSMKSSARIHLYDKDKNFISAIMNKEELVPFETSFVVPENCAYIRMSCNTTAKDIAYIRVGTTEALWNYFVSQSGSNPIATVKENCGGYAGIFDSICIVGDSLASGELEYLEDGVTKYLDCFEYSWGTFMGKAMGSTIHHLSKGGLTTKSWLTNFAHKLSEHKSKAYIVALGVNDQNATSFSLGTSADIDQDNYTNNADSFYGNYAEIIQRIKESQPKAKIFCVTKPNVVGTADDDHLAYNEAIREISEMFGCYLIDLFAHGDNYFTNATWRNRHYQGNHMNILGYKWCSWMFMQYIDSIIRNNLADFEEVGFIGTNYKYLD